MKIYKNLDLNDLEGEIWKDIPNYEDLYQVSNSYNNYHAYKLGLKFPSRQKQIKCNENDKIYKNIKYASEELKISCASIYDVLK